MNEKTQNMNVSPNRPKPQTDLLRRRLVTALAALPLFGSPLRAEEVIDLTWTDLLPVGETSATSGLSGLVQHENAPLMSQQPETNSVRTDWNGQIVRLPGYIVPIDYEGTGVVSFILVPFVGACVHVPPPPPNQLVFVTTETPYQSSGLFEAVNVVGMFGVSSTATQLAEIGYALSADKIEPYRL